MTDVLGLVEPTWFVGCGNMAGAIVEGWRAAGLNLGGAVVIRPSGTPVEGVRTVTSPAEAGAVPAMVVLGFKPQKLDEVAGELRRYLGAQTIVVSLLAGVEAASLRQRFPGTAAIVRAMPNLPVAVRRGVTGLYAADASDEVRRYVGDLFAALGFAMWMADEAKLFALGTVAGSGPAYFARFIAALAKAGVDRGLTEEIANTLALETAFGTSWLATATGEDMANIARRVASPNGTTEAALAVLDRDPGLNQLLTAALEAASRRGAVLASEARSALLEEGSLEAGERLH
jgi:pyrroline-5-carboxylate reductase